MDPYTADTVLAHMCMQYGPLHSRYSAGTCTFLKRLKSLNFPPSLAATALLPRPSRCSTTTTSLTTSTHSGTEGVEPGSCDMLKNAPLGTCREEGGYLSEHQYANLHASIAMPDYRIPYIAYSASALSSWPRLYNTAQSVDKTSISPTDHTHPNVQSSWVVSSDR